MKTEKLLKILSPILCLAWVLPSHAVKQGEIIPTNNAIDLAIGPVTGFMRFSATREETF